MTFQLAPVVISPGGTFDFGQKQVYLSYPVDATATLSGPNGGNLIVDNLLTVNETNVCPNGGSCFFFNFDLTTGGPIENTFLGVAPINISDLLTPGANLYTFNLIDQGAVYGNTAIDLTTTCTVFAPTSEGFPVCHHDNGKKGKKTIYVDSLDSVNAHLRNHDGDTAGACAGS